MDPESGNEITTGEQPAEPVRPDFDLVLVRACVVALWADESMAAAERDALSQVIASVARTQRQRDRLRRLAMQDLNRHEVLAEVAALEPAERLHLFDRCLAVVTSDRKLSRRELAFLRQLQRQCGVRRWPFERRIYALLPSWRRSALVIAGILAVAAAAWLLRPEAPTSLPEDPQLVADSAPALTTPEESTIHPDLLLPPPPDDPPTLDSKQLYEAVRRSVVTVYVEVDGQLMASGSGAVIGIDSGRNNYFVITNRHVVIHEVPGEHTLSFEVEFENEARFTSLLDFYSRRHDLALLAVAGTPLWAQAVAMRTRADLEVGEPVYALGSPVGLRHTFTSGLISALRPEHIQTDATVHSGSSGGPLFDSHGLLCGVVTATHTSKDFSFALYADAVFEMLAERQALTTSAAAPGGD